MAQKIFVVEGRQFRTQSDYARAVHDKELIDKIRKEINLQDRAQLEQLKADLKNGKYKFMTLLGQDFRDEVEELLKKAEKQSPGQKDRRKGKTGKKPAAVKTQKVLSEGSTQGRTVTEDAVLEELKRQEKRRRLIIAACSIVAVCCLGYFGIYSYFDYRTSTTYETLSNLKENQTAAALPAATPQFTLDDSVPEPKEVLDEYKNLLNKNKKLIGWVKIDDTNINYPVMQTSDNEYYLDHNLNQEYDKNGSIFMDKDCDVLKPSTNYILYGHHMKSGQMFGDLDLYSNEEYYKEHPYIQFDTIYEKGTYQIMYVFRSHVYREEEIAFKYYQFIDVNSEQEFDSYMREMAEMSYYDTGVSAQYGDQLLTLSTCDYQEKDGRFVVVAKKIAKE